MKLMNLKAHDPEFTAKGQKGLSQGSRLEPQIWAAYQDDPERLRDVATAIRQFIETPGTAPPAEPADDDVLAPEGRLLLRVHRACERSLQNRRRKIESFRRTKGRVFCECCGFDFERAYGRRGEGFIECHHQTPEHTLRPGVSLKLADLRLVCSNCHRMIHVRPPWLTVEELKQSMNTEPQARRLGRPVDPRPNDEPRRSNVQYSHPNLRGCARSGSNGWAWCEAPFPAVCRIRGEGPA